jgi:hypothetical protein
MTGLKSNPIFRLIPTLGNAPLVCLPACVQGVRAHQSGRGSRGRVFHHLPYGLALIPSVCRVQAKRTGCNWAKGTGGSGINGPLAHWTSLTTMFFGREKSFGTAVNK